MYQRFDFVAFATRFLNGFAQGVDVPEKLIALTIGTFGDSVVPHDDIYKVSFSERRVALAQPLLLAFATARAAVDDRCAVSVGKTVHGALAAL